MNDDQQSVNSRGQRPDSLAYSLPVIQPTKQIIGDEGSSDDADASDGTQQPAVRHRFACPACETAHQAASVPPTTGQLRSSVLRLGMAIFFTMNVMVFTMVLWSPHVYVEPDADGPLATSLRGLFRYLAMIFSVPVLLLLGGPILRRVLEALRAGVMTTDLLILLGVAAAYLYSTATVIRGTGDIYFEVACMVLIFVSIGRWLEANGRRKTSASLDALARLLPEHVHVFSAGQCKEIPRSELRLHDTIRVLPGERMPIDGTIVFGTAEMDEQVLSGESRPVTKTIGDAVYSGTLNVDGDLQVEATSIAGEETISRLMELIRTARLAKGRYQNLADSIATWFVPTVFLIAIAACFWHGFQSGVEEGIMAGLAVVLIACPCALGLATPVAVWTALGHAARQQVLFRSGEALEKLADIRAIRFDKTGTITSGEPQIEHFLVRSPSDEGDALRIASFLASGSKHTYSAAICRRTTQDHHIPLDAAEVHTHGGKGLTADQVDSFGQVALGNLRLMHDLGWDIPSELHQRLDDVQGHDSPLSYVGWDGAVKGIFVFREEVRPGAEKAMRECGDLDLNIEILTGDHERRACRIAEELGVAVAAELLPADKVEAIAHTRETVGSVAMVGDGLNDAPALVEADVGIAMGCGADLSRDAASVCLLSDDLDRVNWAITLARRTIRIVRQNLFWAFFYNIIGIGLAVTGRLNPMLAAIAMALSSLIVVTNSLRLNQPLRVGDEQPSPFDFDRFLDADRDKGPQAA